MHMYKKHELKVTLFEPGEVFAEGLDQGAVSGGEIEVLPDDDDD